MGAFPRAATAGKAAPTRRFRIDRPGAASYKPAMRRILAPLLAVLVLAAAAYTGYWHHIAGTLRGSVAPWAEARRAEGYALRWDEMTVTGFPTGFRLRFDRASIARQTPLPYEVRIPLLVAEAAPWDLEHWRLAAPKGGEIALPAEETTVAAASLDGALALGDPGGTTITLAAHRVAGGDAAAGLAVAEAEARLTLPAAAPASHRDTRLDLSLQLAGLTLPRAVPPFDGTIETLSLRASLKGALPSGPPRRSLAAWRDDGGTVELEEGRLRWGKLDASANGALALDGSLQPIGALTATIEGHDAIVDAAVAAGSLRAGDARLAKIVLGLMAQPGADGRRRITLPVSVQEGRLYLGPAEIAALPTITW